MWVVHKNHLLNNVSGKGDKKGNFALETLNRYNLSQMIKVNSNGEKSCYYIFFNIR